MTKRLIEISSSNSIIFTTYAIPRKKRGCPLLETNCFHLVISYGIPQGKVLLDLNVSRGSKDDLSLRLEERHKKAISKELMGSSFPFLAFILQVIARKMQAHPIAPIFELESIKVENAF